VAHACHIRRLKRADKLFCLREGSTHEVSFNRMLLALKMQPFRFDNFRLKTGRSGHESATLRKSDFVLLAAPSTPVEVRQAHLAMRSQWMKLNIFFGNDFVY
jgi:hypothetical protein